MSLRWSSPASLLIAAVAGGACGGLPSSPSATPGAATSAASPSASPAYDSPSDLRAGDCFDPIVDKDDDESVLAVIVKPCTVPHLGEAIGVAELPAASDAPWPGEGEVDRDSESLCVTAFEEFVGISFDDSTLDGYWIGPTEEAWPGGDRAVICAVEAHPSQPFTSSVRGSKR